MDKNEKQGHDKRQGGRKEKNQGWMKKQGWEFQHQSPRGYYSAGMCVFFQYHIQKTQPELTVLAYESSPSANGPLKGFLGYL